MGAVKGLTGFAQGALDGGNFGDLAEGTTDPEEFGVGELRCNENARPLGGTARSRWMVLWAVYLRTTRLFSSGCWATTS